MSLFISFTGIPKAKIPDGTIENEMLECINYAQENRDGIGDDDLDTENIHVTYYEDGSRVSKILQSIAERKGLKTVSLYPIDFSKRSPICWSDYRIGYDKSVKTKKFYENSDIVFCLGKPTNFFRMAGKYNCVSMIVELTNNNK